MRHPRAPRARRTATGNIKWHQGREHPARVEESHHHVKNHPPATARPDPARPIGWRPKRRQRSIASRQVKGNFSSKFRAYPPRKAVLSGATVLETVNIEELSISKQNGSNGLPKINILQFQSLYNVRHGYRYGSGRKSVPSRAKRPRGSLRAPGGARRRTKREDSPCFRVEVRS